MYKHVFLPNLRSNDEINKDNRYSYAIPFSFCNICKNVVINIAAYKRRKKRSHKFPPNLPRREVIIKAEDRICSCGKEKKLIRYEITELLNYLPEVFEVIEQKREVLACSCGCGSITTAALPKRILPKVKITESTLAHIIISKLDDRQPLYHQEKKFDDRFGIDLSRNNLARWFIDSAKALQPLIN
ncbi:MAG: transposase, partial [Candidatus Neomarinimicrobiota bacterium]